MAGSPAGFRPPPGVPVPSPSPAHYGQSHFAPPRPISGTPPTPVQIQPTPVHSMQSPVPMPPAPHYAMQGYQQPQYAPGPPPVGYLPQMPPAPAPAYDQHRMVPVPAAMTPQRMPIVPAANTAPMSHGNVYNPPRPVEVYTLPEAMNAAIPADVRDQFHHDEQGRVLFFTEPPRVGNDPPVAPEIAGLGHSVRYLADIQKDREEREKKRKALEEFRSEVARKKAVLHAQMQRKKQQESQLAATEAVAELFARIIQENGAIEGEVADWRAAKSAWEEEKKKHTAAEKAKKGEPAAMSVD